MPTETRLDSLVQPDLEMSYRQNGNQVTVSLSIPRSHGTAEANPLLTAFQNDRERLFESANTAFLREMNRGGIELSPISATITQNAGGSLGANLTVPVRGVPVGVEGNLRYEQTYTVSGGATFNSGKVDDAMRRGNEALDNEANEIARERTAVWMTRRDGQLLTTVDGVRYRVSPEASETFYQNTFWHTDPRRYGDPNGDGASLPGNGNAVASAGQPTDPMRTAAREGIERLDTTRLGLSDPNSLDRTVAALAAESRRNGLDRVDSVVASPDGQRIFAVQGDPNRPDHLRASVDVATAARQPVETSERLIREAAPTLAVEPALQETRARSVG